MSTALTLFQSQVDYLLSADNGELQSTARVEMIKAALETYSRDNPHVTTADVTGDGGKYYVISGSTLTGWVEGYSAIQSIEYPAATVASDEQPQYLDADDWNADYRAGGVRYLYLPNHAPAATEAMRITYTVPYAFAGDPLATETPTGDFFALCNLAAGLCCQAIAARYARLGDSTMGIDSASTTTKSQNYAYRAKEFIKLYRQHMGLDGESEVKAAGAFANWDTEPGWPANRRYVYHGNR